MVTFSRLSLSRQLRELPRQTLWKSLKLVTLVRVLTGIQYHRQPIDIFHLMSYGRILYHSPSSLKIAKSDFSTSSSKSSTCSSKFSTYCLLRDWRKSWPHSGLFGSLIFIHALLSYFTTFQAICSVGIIRSFEYLSRCYHVSPDASSLQDGQV